VLSAAPDHVESVRVAILDALTPAQMAQFGQLAQIVLTHLDPDGPWAGQGAAQEHDEQ
jgi:hypothetical protein